MSMILDALKRADRERRQQDLEVPTLDTSHGERPPAARNRHLWLIGSGLLVSLTLLAGGVILIQTPWQPEPGSANPQTKRGTAQTQPAQTRSTSREQPATNPQQAAIEALYQEQEQKQRQPEQDSGPKLTREEIANLYRRAIETTPEQTPGRKTLATESAETTANTNSAAGTESPVATATLSAAEPQSLTSSTSVPDSSQTGIEDTDSAEASSDGRQLAARGLPQIHTLPQAMQRNIPSINYQEHHYQPGGGSWVRLNRERMQVGDQINPDLRIESIDREGLVLNYQGRSFRLKALNSWINM